MGMFLGDSEWLEEPPTAIRRCCFWFIDKYITKDQTSVPVQQGDGYGRTYDEALRNLKVNFDRKDLVILRYEWH